VYSKAADPGEVVIQKQHFAIDDIRGRATATLVNFLPHPKIAEDKKQISGVGRHQGGRRSMSPGLHRIESVSSRCRMLLKDVRWLVNSLPVRRDALFFAISERRPDWIDDLGRVGLDRGGRAYGDLMTGTLSSWTIYCVSYLINAAGELSLTYG
jgi:hypothetical protein